VLLAATLGCSSAGAPASTASPSHRSAHQFAGTPTVGALYLPNTYPTAHTCTASVVRSRSRNVIVTAAHCLNKGTDAGYTFVPGYDDGQAPYGVWKTIAAFGSPPWVQQTAASTRRDWAFLRVANHTGAHGKVLRLQDVVGGNRLGSTAKPGQRVAVPGYVAGGLDKPITCRAKVYRHQGYPAFNCGGYQGGVSGSPWLTGHGKVRTIVGVIGGLHQGGCSPSTSYSAPLGPAARSLLKRAERHRHGDTFPNAPGDGCKAAS
jgi:V8-like Glu-specific endopeptidase